MQILKLKNFWKKTQDKISVTLASVQSLNRVRLCDLMNCSTPGLPVHHQLPESTQIECVQLRDFCPTDMNFINILKVLIEHLLWKDTVLKQKLTLKGLFFKNVTIFV